MGVIKIKFPNAEWHIMHAHKLSYLVHHNILCMEPGMEVSHLCHVPLCDNVEHLSLEPHATNTERLKCVNRGSCAGHGVFRDGLFVCGKYSQC